MSKEKTARDRGIWQGQNGLRPEKRLAIYLRDGMACVYCGQEVEAGVVLTLDHLTPASKGGSNSEKNLVTCCQKCNSSRGVRPVAAFIRAVAGYTGRQANDVAAHVRNCAARSITKHKQEAKELISRRGSVATVVQELFNTGS